MSRRKDPQPETLQPEIIETVPPDPAPLPPSLSQTEEPHAAPFAAEVDPVANIAADPVLPPEPPRPQAASRPGVLAPLLGGALAAIGGFALSHFNVLGLATPAEPVDLSPLTQQIEELSARDGSRWDKVTGDISALTDRIATIEAAPASDPGRLDALDKRLAAIEALPTDGTASTAALASKIAELEQRIATLPAGGGDGELQQRLDDALARLTEAEAAATARADEAEAAASQAARDKALASLSDAVTTGQPFASELEALADPALSKDLGAMAEAGVPTLANLQEIFPDAARQALREARNIGTQDGWGDRFLDFLATQTGARSLTPLEGDTPDAILSRAEFALSEGRVDAALAELSSLDPGVKAPLDTWISQAEAYIAAASALKTARGE